MSYKINECHINNVKASNKKWKNTIFIYLFIIVIIIIIATKSGRKEIMKDEK